MLQADNIRNQLKRTMERFDLDLVSIDHTHKDYFKNIRMAVTTGYFMQVAHKGREKGVYTTRDGQLVGLHPSCGLEDNPEWVLYNEVRSILLRESTSSLSYSDSLASILLAEPESFIFSLLVRIDHPKLYTNLHGSQA
jgi:hypothetical protein